MHVLTVIDHHNNVSFTHAVAAQFNAGVAHEGHSFEVADLHAEGFNPVWQAADTAQFEDQPMPPDIIAEQTRIARCDAKCLAFPLWWWGMPSMLKGWIDRVFSWNWAYNQTENSDPSLSLLKTRPCVLLVPAGASSEPTIEGGYQAAMLKLWQPGTLDYFGLKAQTHFLYGSEGKPARRAAHLKLAFEIGKGLTGQPPDAR